LLEEAHKLRIACIGDLMLDRYVCGDLSPMSPEPPAPVLIFGSEWVSLGGMGNVVRNVAALGGRATAVGVVGSDSCGDRVRALLADVAAAAHLVTDSTRRTTVKTRFSAGTRRLLRIDEEDGHLVSGSVEAAAIEMVTEGIRGADLVLISDYGKGVVTDAVVAACLEEAKSAGVMTLLDTKANQLGRFVGIDLIKLNAAELSEATEMPTTSDVEVEAALLRGLAVSGCDSIFVTRGAQGISLATSFDSVRHFPGIPAQARDACGAGDTTLAALGVALAAGASLAEAGDFANLAASLVVQAIGTTTTSPHEMLASASSDYPDFRSKIVPLEELIDATVRWKRQGLTIGFTNGCFDILHIGHVNSLQEARLCCDRLIVGVNSDASVRSLKGSSRPINDLQSRLTMVAALSSVDQAVPFDDLTPVSLINEIRPDVLIKGSDYLPEDIAGGDLVGAWGGRVATVALVQGISTSSLISRILSLHK